MPPPEDLSALLSRVALSDRTAFRALYGLTSPKLLGLVLRLVRNRAEAEDILQETYVKVWQNAGQYRSTAHGAMAWLATVARNSAIDRLRRNPRPAADLDAALDFASQDPTPEAAAISASRRRQLDDCLKTTDAAEAIRGAYLEGHSYEDLARHFGVPLNTMKTRLRRGLMKLKDCLGHDA